MNQRNDDDKLEKGIEEKDLFLLDKPHQLYYMEV